VRIVMRWGNLPVPPNPSTGPLRGRTPGVGPKKFAEPVALSSTASADLPLAGTALGLGFDLLALRARRKQHTNVLHASVKRVETPRVRNLRTFLFPTARERFLQRDTAPKRRKPAGAGGTKKNSPSRFRFRPPLPLTFPFRVLPSDSASTYSRSVLGASSTLTRGGTGSRGQKRTCPQFAEISFSNISTANLPACGKVCGKESRGPQDARSDAAEARRRP
jgi:hypothetical protein